MTEVDVTVSQQIEALGGIVARVEDEVVQQWMLTMIVAAVTFLLLSTEAIVASLRILAIETWWPRGNGVERPPRS
jgi:hypothetical protein